MILSLEIALAIAKPILSQLTKSKAPADIINATSAAIDAWKRHRNDLLTKENFKAQRG